MCQCRTPAGTPLPCEYCWCIPGFCQLLANMKTLFLNPQQLLYKLLLKDFPNAFWKSSWLYLLDFPFLLTLACQCFQRNLTDTWVMTTDAKCDEHTIFIHICTPPVPSNSFLTRLWNGGGGNESQESESLECFWCFSIYSYLKRLPASHQRKTGNHAIHLPASR